GPAASHLRSPRAAHAPARHRPRQLAPGTTPATRRRYGPHGASPLPPLWPPRPTGTAAGRPPARAGAYHTGRTRGLPARALALHDLSGRLFPPPMSSWA